MKINKKTSFLILLAVLFVPLFAQAANTITTMADEVKKIAVSIGTAIVVIGWIIAGILYLTAAGAPDKVQTAKKAMIASIIGTVLVVIAALGYDVIKTLLNPVIGA